MLARLGHALPQTVRLSEGQRERLERRQGADSPGLSGFEPTPRVPPGLQHVHPSWLRRVLHREPPPVAAALARALADSGLHGLEGPWLAASPAPLAAGFEAQLAWALFGPLADPEPAASPSQPSHTAPGEWASGASRAVLWQRLPGNVLWRVLCERGAAEVGRSLHRSEAVMRARAMAMVGAPWAQVIARFASEPVEEPARERARVSVAKASSLAAKQEFAVEDAGRPEPEIRLAFVGLCAAAHEIGATGPAAVRTIALRLPAALGGCLWPGGGKGPS